MEIVANERGGVGTGATRLKPALLTSLSLTTKKHSHWMFNHYYLTRDNEAVKSCFIF